MRILAVDYGKSNIGLAISDPTCTISQPLEVVKTSHALDRIGNLIKSLDISLIVMGLPINMDGTEGKMAREVRNFAKDLEERFNIKVIFWDERLTSSEAESVLRKSGLGWRKSKGKVDKIAAALILKSFLEKQGYAFSG